MLMTILVPLALLQAPQPCVDGDRFLQTARVEWTDTNAAGATENILFFVSTLLGGYDYDNPTFVASTGVTSIELSQLNLPPDDYCMVTRFEDSVGNQSGDSNGVMFTLVDPPILAPPVIQLVVP